MKQRKAMQNWWLVATFSIVTFLIGVLFGLVLGITIYEQSLQYGARNGFIEINHTIFKLTPLGKEVP